MASDEFDEHQDLPAGDGGRDASLDAAGDDELDADLEDLEDLEDVLEGWQEAQWQLAVCVGGADLDAELTEAVVVAGGLAELQAAALSAADLRSRTVVVVPDSSVESLSSWAYVSGLAGRVLDVVVGDELYDCTGPLSSGRVVGEHRRPAHKVESVEVTVSEVLGGLGQALVDEVRYARRATLVWADDPVLYQAAAWLAGVRDRRGDGGRLPLVLIGDDEVDLEGVRLAGAGRRRETNAAANQSLVEAVELSGRQERLIAAADVDVREVLSAMGSNHSGELWNCPRPGRHTHGDAVPSMKVSENSARCFRCDTEWVDPLRLVMDAMQLGPDDAGRLLLGLDEGSFGPYSAAIVAEREARSNR